MKALITGGSGYFGSLLVNRLLSNNWECRVLDINEFKGDSEVEFIKGDIRNIDLLHKACNQVDIVFHNVAQVPLSAAPIVKLTITEESVFNPDLETNVPFP